MTAHDAKNSTEPIDHLHRWDNISQTYSYFEVDAYEEVKHSKASKHVHRPSRAARFGKLEPYDGL